MEITGNKFAHIVFIIAERFSGENKMHIPFAKEYSSLGYFDCCH